jgi:hypothetical protein
MRHRDEKPAGGPAGLPSAPNGVAKTVVFPTARVSVQTER